MNPYRIGRRKDRNEEVEQGNDKKIEERFWFRRFQIKFGECPRSEPNQPDLPSLPDFVFADEDLGIEVTRFIRGQGRSGSPLREREEIRSKVIHEAQTLFEAERHQALIVWVCWSGPECPAKREQKALSKEIQRLIACHVPQHDSQCEVNISSELLDTPLLQTHLTGIRILKLRGVQNGFWKWQEGGFVGENINAMQALIDAKNVKVEAYRKLCKTVWLLIVASTGRVSSKLHPEDRLAKTRFRTLFDRVFVYDAFKETVEELQIER
jgi:hypothetical protein